MLCAKQYVIQFRIVFSIYLRSLMVRQLPELELYEICKGYSKWKIIFVDSLSVTFLGSYDSF